MFKAQSSKLKIICFCIIISCNQKPNSQSETRGIKQNLAKGLSETDDFKLLQKSFASRSFLEIVSKEKDKYGGEAITLKVSDDTKKILQGNWLAKLTHFFGPNIPWHGSWSRGITLDNPKSIEIENAVGRDLTVPIYSIFGVAGSKSLPEVLGMKLKSNMFGVVETVTVPDVQSLSKRIEVFNQKLPNEHKIALGFYAVNGQENGQSTVRKFAESGSLPMSSIDQNPAFFEHDMSVHLKELITVSPKIRDRYQDLTRDVVKFMDYLEDIGGTFGGVFTKRPRYSPKGLDKSYTIIEPNNYAPTMILNVLLNRMSGAIDSELFAMGDFFNPIVTKIKDRSWNKRQLAIQQTFEEFVIKSVNLPPDLLSKEDLDNIMKGFLYRNPDLKNKRYLPLGMTSEDLTRESREHIRVLNQVAKENPM